VDRRAARTSRGRDHDCKRAGCQPHVFRPLTAKTIRNIHSILSGAFSTAERWEWISWNPAESAKPPTVTRRPVPATAPEDVARVIAEGRKTHPAMALYLWLVAITGARRGELCALQVCNVDLENGVLHLAYNYVVVGGRRVRKDQDASGPVPGHRPGYVRDAPRAPGGDSRRARRPGARAARGCLRVLQ
jgi:integrase